MTWEEFVSKALENGVTLVKVGYKNYEATLKKTTNTIHAIKLLGVYGNFYFISDGDIFFLSDKNVKSWVKLLHISQFSGYERMFKFVEVLT